MGKTVKTFVINVIGLIFFVFGALPNVTHAADLFFSPSTGSGTVGSGFNVVAKLDTRGVIANAVDASIVFPANKLRVASISTNGSAVSLWVMSPQFDNAAGTITFTGGQPRPGFNGSSVTLATITFVPITTGSATISYTGISVLSGDGLASELLSGLGSATFTLNPAPPPPPPPPPTPPPAPVIVYVPVPAPAPEPIVCPPQSGSGYAPPSPTTPDEPTASTTPGETPSTAEPATDATPAAVSCDLAVVSPATEAPPAPANALQGTLWNVSDYLSPLRNDPPVITPVRGEDGKITCPVPPEVTAAMSVPPIQKPIQGAVLPIAASVFGILWLNEKMSGWSAKAVKAITKVAAKKLPPAV